MDDQKRNPAKKDIVYLEPEPVTVKKTAADSKVQEEVRIDKVGSLTLNVFTEPFKKRYETHYRGKHIHLIIDLVLGAIVLILLGVVLNIWLFSRTKTLNLIDFQVKSVPENLVNGQEAEFTISYTNTTKETLTDVYLILNKAKTLHEVTYSTPDFDTKTNTLKIGDLAAGAHGEFKIQGFLLGDLGTKQEYLAVINYKNQYGQKRQEFFSQKFEVQTSVAQVNLQLPSRIIATSPFTSTVNLKNSSQINFENLRIKMVWPANFTFLNSELGSATNNLWQIGDFKAGQEKAYTFNGKQYIREAQKITIKAEVYVDYDKTEYLLASLESNAPVDFSKFKLNFSNLGNNQSINPGESADYTVTYTNGENYAITNVEIGLEVSGEYADKQPVKLNRNNVPQLSKIEPGQSGSVTLKAKAKTNIDFSGPRDKGYQLEVRGIASYDDPVEKSRISVESSPTVSIVSSKLSLSSLGLFYTSQGDQLGVGSVPPVVGEYTSYWTIIKVINSNNPIKDLKVTATVPAGIEFTDIYNVTAGDQIVYNSASGQIIWTINNVSAFAGIFNPAPEARIQLAITPTAKQAGTSPVLLTNITATATDTLTNAFLSASAKNITTAIFNEPNLNKVIE